MKLNVMEKDEKKYVKKRALSTAVHKYEASKEANAKVKEEFTEKKTTPIANRRDNMTHRIVMIQKTKKKITQPIQFNQEGTKTNQNLKNETINENSDDRNDDKETTPKDTTHSNKNRPVPPGLVQFLPGMFGLA